MKIKKIIGTSILTFISCVPLLAHADLIITNYTYQDSTSIINGGSCSNWLPGGVTEGRKPGGPPVVNKIPDVIVQAACLHVDNPFDTSCIADVFMTNHCGAKGEEVATVYFDTKKGIQNVIKKSDEYIISGTGFNIKVETPAKK